MFITFEGMEGSGKSTALDAICRSMADSGKAVLRTREPGGSELGASLRALLLDARQDVAPEAELFLYLADRAQHVSRVIRPALEAGTPVFSDRYADSTIVYQGYGRGLDVNELYRLNQLAVGRLWPELTLIFDLDPEIGLGRARTRNAGAGLDVSEGRFEAEALEFHRRIREGYLAWALHHPERFRIVDAALPPEDVVRQAWDHLYERFGRSAFQ